MSAQTSGEYAKWAERVKNPKRMEIIGALLQTELRKPENENLSAEVVAKKLVEEADKTVNQHRLKQQIIEMPEDIKNDIAQKLQKNVDDISLVDLAKYHSALKTSMEAGAQQKLSEIHKSIDEKTLSEFSRVLDFGTALEAHSKDMDENLQNTTNYIHGATIPNKSVLNDAIKALPETEKNDKNSILNSLHTKIESIEKDIATLHGKAKTNNPTQLEALQIEAHNILRKLGNVGDMLNDANTRNLIETKFQDKKEYEKLREYLDQLSELQKHLINNIAGPQKDRFTPIPHPLFDTREESRMLTASKLGGAITGISYKKWVKDDPNDPYSKAGKWVDVKDELHDSKGNKIDLTGMTPEILREAKRLAEEEIRKTSGDKNYSIKVSENDTSMTFSTGNSRNRQVFFDKIGEVMAARKQAAATSAVQYGAGTPAQQPTPAASVTHATGRPAQHGSGAKPSAAAADSDDTPQTPRQPP